MTPQARTPSGGAGPLGKVQRFVLDQPFVIACVLAIVAICWLLYSTRTQPHHVRAVFTNAMSVSRGLDVQIDGVDVGKVGKVQYDDGRAIVELGVEDDHWPLPQGTTAELRFGTTLGNGTRLVELRTPPGGKGDAIAEDGVLPEADNQSAVEFDDVFNTLNRDTRKRVQSATGRMGDALAPHAERLNKGIKSAPAALEATADVFTDLDRDSAALRSLVTDGDRVTRVLGARRAEISGLVDVAASTFDAFATHSDGIRNSLSEFAPALGEARLTLARLDGSVGRLDELVDDARPGAKALRPLAADAGPALRQLTRAMPVALETLRMARVTAPDTTRLLRVGQPFSERLDPAMAGLAPSVGCIRPYAPEIAGMMSNWTSFTQSYDSKSHYDRVKINAGPTSFNNQPGLSTDAFLAATGGGLKYAMPRPPGLDTGDPFFVPECGAGPEALDPSKDPEDRK